jgi:hypothetical protein
MLRWILSELLPIRTLLMSFLSLELVASCRWNIRHSLVNALFVVASIMTPWRSNLNIGRQLAISEEQR